MTSPFMAQAYALPELVIRPFGPGESTSVSEACAAIDPFVRLGYQAGGLALYFERRDGALSRYVLEQGGRAVGCLAVRYPWLRGPYIEVLAIFPDAQGSGVGRAVVLWVAGKTRSSNLWATVSDFNEPARRFYANLGFIESGVLPGLVAADSSEILLRRPRPADGP